MGFEAHGLHAKLKGSVIGDEKVDLLEFLLFIYLFPILYSESLIYCYVE